MTENQITTFLQKNSQGFYAGIIIGGIIILSSNSADIQILGTILIISVIAGIVLNHFISSTSAFSNKTSQFILLIIGGLGIFYILKQLSVIPFSSFGVPMQAGVSFPNIGTTMSKGGFTATIVGASALLWKIPVIGPYISAILIIGLLIFTGYSVFTVGKTINQLTSNLPLLFGLVGGIILILYLFKRR